jgi:hypothetical protein
VITALSGSRVWNGIVRGSEHLSPAGRPPNQPSLARTVTRATRCGLTASVAALAARAAMDAGAQMGRLVGRRRAVLAAQGDDADRSAYFEAVQNDRRVA